MSNFSPLIQSRSNQEYKQWQRYLSHPETTEHPWIPIESSKQIHELAYKYPIQLLLFSDVSGNLAQPLLSRSLNFRCLSVNLMERLSNVRSPQQLIAFFEKPIWAWKDLTPWVLYLEQLQDPGNLGTLLRTANATGIFSVASSNKSVSFFNEKVIRASAGALFSVPFLENLTLDDLKKHGYNICAATLKEGPSLFEAVFKTPQAFVLGNEGAGLTKPALAIADTCLHVPMHEHSESLNVAVTGSLIAYEILRQKTLNE
ncbi:MAG: RNA methyltransferase [Acidobacteriota bacterium]|nr:RNA methyltransferase [Acidobacteriota bacterium]